MKKYCFIAAVAVAALCGCSKEALQEENTANDVEYVSLTLSAYPESAAVKSALGDDGLSVEWRKGDSVSVFINGTNCKFTADEDGVSAKFTGSVKAGDKSYTGTIVAAYPYNAGYTVDGNSIKGIEIPAVQNLTGGGFDPKANVSVATGTIGNGLKFRNVCTLVKARLDAETAVRGVQLTCPSGYALAGKALTVDASTAEITFPSDYAGCTNTVNLINNTEAGIPGTDFYMAVAPNEKTGDFKLSVFNAEEKFASKTFKTTNAFARNKVVTVKSDAPAKASFIHYGTANCICLYGKAAGESVTIDVTPYIASDSFIATGLKSFSAPVPASLGNVWREKALTSADKTLSSDGVVVSRKDVTCGNMAIAIKKGNTTLWSYHIWVPQDNPGAVLSYPNYDMMPMALGSVNANEGDLSGLLYQWGRKDALGRLKFVNASSGNSAFVQVGLAIGLSAWEEAVSSSASDVRTNIVNSVSSPNVFIKSDSAWAGTDDNFLWANPAGYANPAVISKSIYDPCPEGYMVAPSDAFTGIVQESNVKGNVAGFNWNDLYANTNGYIFVSDGEENHLASTGYRKGADGAKAGGNQAHYWTSSPSKTAGKAVSAYFDRNGNGNKFLPSNEGNVKSTAACVRCVKTK